MGPAPNTTNHKSTAIKKTFKEEILVRLNPIV